LLPPPEWIWWGGGYVYDEVEDMDGTNMVEEHDHPMNHRLGEEGMNMVEYYHPMNHRLEVEDMDMVGIHMVECGVWIWWRSADRTPDRRWRVLIGRIVI
jgi:hypothetical protein